MKEGDDLMAATRYALMMLRHARTKGAFDRMRGKIEYSNAGIVREPRHNVDR